MTNGKNFEEELKKVIFDRIYEMQDKNQEIVANIRTIGKTAGEDFQMSNIGRTATNKLITEIVPQFQKAGLKFYSNSVVSRAVYLQIIDYVAKGHETLKKCNDSLKSNKDSSGEQKAGTNEQVVSLKQSNAVSRFFANFRKAFKKSTNKKSVVTPEGIATAKAHMDEYESLDEQLGQYKLRDNIVQALTEVICPDNNFIYLATTVPELVHEDIAPELTKLGLGDLIPHLEEQLVAKYIKSEEGRIEHCLTQDEVDLYIPNFEKYRAKKGIGVGAGLQQSASTISASEQSGTLEEPAILVEEGIEPSDD